MTDSHGAEIRRRMDAEELWQDGFRGAGVGVAVLDTGFQPDRPEPARVLASRDFTGEDRAIHPANLHGATVAECLSQLAPDARLGNFRVLREHASDRQHAVAAIEAAIAAFPTYRVLNLSLFFLPDGCPTDCPLCAAVDRAFAAGILVVCAAGNEGPAPDTLTCPAGARWVLAATATWPDAVARYWSDRPLREFWMRRVTGAFGRAYGTSFSAGYLSGNAAALISAFPEVDADTLRFAMLRAANADAQEGRATARVSRMRAELSRLQGLVRAGAMVTKSGTLRPFVDPF